MGTRKKAVSVEPRLTKSQYAQLLKYFLEERWPLGVERLVALDVLPEGRILRTFAALRPALNVPADSLSLAEFLAAVRATDAAPQSRPFVSEVVEAIGATPLAGPRSLLTARWSNIVEAARGHQLIIGALKEFRVPLDELKKALAEDIPFS